MKLKYLFGIALLALISMLVVFNLNNNIAKSRDYKVFLNTKFQQAQLKNNDAELNFWNQKLKQDTGSFVSKLEIGFNTLAHFKLTGNVNDLSTADSLFYNVNVKLKNKDASVYLALAQNAITQHKFKEAEQFVFSAEKIGADANTINLLKFDVNMELGNYLAAKLCLKRMANLDNNFDCLIRKSKYEDYEGRSDASILAMEKAYSLLKYSNKKSAQVWVTTNLADMYGHAGRIKDSYNMYLTSLNIDSANLYALKGIANICFANDKNANEAENIYKFILSTTDAPDLFLNLAEISEWKADLVAKEKYINSFIAKIESNSNYGNMYNKYLIDLYLNDKIEVSKGLSIAQNEMNNRKTPETYAWLAIANFKANNVTEATEIIYKNVLNKTHEPLALLVSSQILANSNKELAKKLQTQCMESKFELGPIKYKSLITEM